MLTQSTSTALSVLALGTAVVYGAMVPAAERKDLGGLKLQGSRRSVDFRALASRADPIPIADFQDITVRHYSMKLLQLYSLTILLLSTGRT